jgi:hypothetical protein
MANGDDKKKNLPAGQHSGYTGYVDNLGGAQYYQGEVDEGGGKYSISGQTPGKTLISRRAAYEKAKKSYPDTYGKMTFEEYNPLIDKFYKDKGMTAKQYAAGKKDKQSFTKTSANNVTNTTNNNANNGNTGGGSNIATATGGNATIGDINVGGNGTTTSNQTQQKKTLQPNLRNKNNSSTSSTTSTTSTTSSNRGYTGNTPFNQATATGGNASIGNITINAGGSGGAQTPASKANPNITGANSPLGGGAKGLLSDMIGTGVNTFNKQVPGDSGGPTARRGGSTPYQFRGLQNQFQSWGLNHYNNSNNQT